MHTTLVISLLVLSLLPTKTVVPSTSSPFTNISEHQPMRIGLFPHSEGAGRMANHLLQQTLNFLKNPGMRFLISFDPSRALRQLRRPVLALVGKLALQVRDELLTRIRTVAPARR